MNALASPQAKQFLQVNAASQQPRRFPGVLLVALAVKR
jgi:hypothetical protein